MPLRFIAVALSLRRASRLRRVAALASNRANMSRRLLPQLRLSARLLKLGSNCMPLCGAICNRGPRVPYSSRFLIPAKTQNVQMLTCIGAQRPFDADEPHAITLRIQKNSKEDRTEKLRAFSQTLLSVAALLNKWRAARQMLCKRKILGINKPCRHELRHREISIIISARLQHEFTTTRSRSSAMK